MKKSRRKMAFTLTELLVVVVIIGVLAAVVMPKYARMLDTRKTTEAEEIMRAIRTEQERRCSLGKDYATNMTQLADLVPNANSQYYTYALFDNGKGVTATTAAGSSLNYTLRMPSVVDGRICCEGGNCDQLNKDYPSCTNFQYVSAGGCSSEVGEGDDPGVVYQCSGNQPVDERSCPEGCGTQVNKYQCDQTTGEWIPGQWEGECVQLPAPSVVTIPITCEGGDAGTKTCTISYSCDGDTSSECTDDCPCYKWEWERINDPGAVPSHGYCDCPIQPEPTGECDPSSVGYIRWQECLYESTPEDPRPDPGYSGSNAGCGYDYQWFDYKCARKKVPC